jgi:hypothetical protein
VENINLFELYEKLYFHEVEAREKISSRLQIPLAIILAIISVFAHIIKGITLKCPGGWHVFFWLLFLLSLILFLLCISYFCRSFYGHSYQFLPSAKETENYRQQLIETYKEYEDADKLTNKYFEEYVFKYYNECSSANTKVNDLRSELLHKCNTFLIICALPLVGSFLLFTLAGIDKNSVEKEYKIHVTNPIKLESLLFSKEIAESFKASELKAPNSENNKEKPNGKGTSETTTTSSTASEENNKGRRANPETSTNKTSKK